MTIFENFLSADVRTVAIIVGLASGVASSVLMGWVNYLISEKRLSRMKLEIFDKIAVELVTQRVEPYTMFMQELQILSSFNLTNSSESQLKKNANNAATVIQNHIYGKFGLLAYHETREMALRLRAKCIIFANGESSAKELWEAAWKLHQMLRSDLGLPQPGLSEGLRRLRKNETASATIHDIEQLTSKIKHIKWPTVSLSNTEPK